MKLPRHKHSLYQNFPQFLHITIILNFNLIIVDCYEKKFGIILYNPSGREGAVEEAHNFQSGLQAVGCHVIRAEWTTKRELSSLIDEGVNIVAGCSLLVVCIMSHGGAGTLRCEEGETREIVINDVIQKLRGKLPELTPLVCVIG